MLNEKENLDKDYVKIQTSGFYKILKKFFADIEVRTEIFEILLKLIKTPNNLLKVYLAIFVLVSSGLAAYTVIMSFIGYFSYEVITTTRTINETPTKKLAPRAEMAKAGPGVNAKNPPANGHNQDNGQPPHPDNKVHPDNAKVPAPNPSPAPNPGPTPNPGLVPNSVPVTVQGIKIKTKMLPFKTEVIKGTSTPNFKFSQQFYYSVNRQVNLILNFLAYLIKI